ncbi:MAG: MATE family efflux transporter [Longicatena sp.]
MKNMTEGNTTKLILAFAIPVLLGNIFQQFYNMADTMMVGQILGVKALAAMGAGASLSGLVIGLVSGVSMGVSIMIAQYYGAKDEKGMKMAVAGCIRLCTIIVCIIVFVALLVKRPVLQLLQTPTSIIDMTDTYLTIIIVGLFVTMAYNAMASMLRSIGDSKTPLYFLIVASLTNVLLDYIFIAYFHWGIAGAGYATVISQVLSVVLCFFYMKKKYPMFILHRGEYYVEKDILNKQLSMGISMGLMNSIVSVGSVVLQSAVNGLGEITIAAHTAARKVAEMFMQPLISIAIADTTFVSQNLGAKKYHRIREGLKHSVWISFIWVLFVILISFFGVDKIIGLLVSSTETKVVSLATYYCRVSAGFYFVLAILFIYRNSLQGMGNGRIPIISSIIEMVVKVVATFALIPYTGYTGVCLAEPIAWSLMAPVLFIFFYKDIKERERWEVASK